MAPNAEGLRFRKFGNDDDNDDDVDVTVTTIERTCPNVSYLKSNEVAIDGMIYKIDTFHHPGGESIQVFGGNDCTVQYRMIHPYHTSKHLEKMECVGKVLDYKCE